MTPRTRDEVVRRVEAVLLARAKDLLPSPIPGIELDTIKAGVGATESELARAVSNLVLGKRLALHGQRNTAHGDLRRPGVSVLVDRVSIPGIHLPSQEPWPEASREKTVVSRRVPNRPIHYFLSHDAS